MKINLDDLKNPKTIVPTFTQIKPDTTEITIDGGSFKEKKYSKKIAQGLSLLPKHVKKVSFCGHYAVHNEGGIGDLIFDVESGLIKYYKALPDSVTSLGLKFNLSEGHSQLDYGDKQLPLLIKGLKENITELDLSELIPGNTANRSIATLYQNIPKTVTSLKIRYNLGSIPARIKKLHFYEYNWASYDEERLRAYFSSLPKDLESLNLNNCSLSALDLSQFDIIMSNLPGKQLIKLGLSNNYLNTLLLLTEHDIQGFAHFPDSLRTHAEQNLINSRLKEFTEALKKIAPTVKELDFSEDDRLDYDTKHLKIILDSLPKTVTRLQLHRIVINQSTNFDTMKEQFGVIPEQINTLIIQQMDINNQDAAERVVAALRNLPETVQIIEFCELFSQTTDAKQINLMCYVFAHLPASVTQIKLPGNNLSGISLDKFGTILSAFSTHIKSIDISDNGFTDLSPARLQSFTAYCPQNATNILLDKNKFIRKLNGMLDRNPAPSVYMDFPNPVMIPKEFAQQILIFSQVVTVLNKKLPLELCLLILSFAFPGMGTDYKRKVQFENKMARKFFSSHLLADNQKTDEIMDNAKQRLFNQTTVADLSHCGLQLLEQSELTELMKTIIPPCEIINLRGNGFGNTPEARVKLRTLLNAIPPHIRYIDLGANHLGRANPKELDALIPKQATYSFSLNDETPLSREEHLIMRKKYSANHQITGSEPELIKHVQKILKRYTSSVKRIFFLPQFSVDEISSIDKIKRLERYIKDKQITRLDDLFYELELINKDASTSSLAQLTYRLRNTLVLAPEQEPQAPKAPGPSGSGY